MVALIFSLIAAASAVGGGMLPLYTRVRNIHSRYLLGFAAGVMLSVAFLEMLPEMVAEGETSFIFLAVGFFSLYVV
ncbi:MAG: ZIP family metal transporter, partial [Dehalococcoidia bacterium]|nr:ZIP family metal transporter [Dehalococcoidia bacterium]